VAKIRICYFLEDRAQEGFIKALVERIITEEGLPREGLIHDIRSARYGSRIIQEFRRFLKDMRRTDEPVPDLFVVAVDGNCKGYNERVSQLRKLLKDTDHFKERIVFAVPDPHIERWYLLDQKALKEATGLARAPDMPAYKCKKDYYKQVLRDALRELQPLLGGVEFAERIARAMTNLESLGQHDAGFARFISDLREQARKLRGELWPS